MVLARIQRRETGVVFEEANQGCPIPQGFGNTCVSAEYVSQGLNTPLADRDEGVAQGPAADGVGAEDAREKVVGSQHPFLEKLHSQNLPRPVGSFSWL